MMMSIALAETATPLEQAFRLVKEQRFEEALPLLYQQIKDDPQDVESRFLLARVLSWRGKYAEAEAEYNQLLKAEPHNSDYMLGKAQVFFWSDRNQQALDLAAKARSATPDYQEIWKLELQILDAEKVPDSTYRASRLRQQAAARFPAETWWIAAAAPVPEPKAPLYLMDASPLPLGLRPELEMGFRYDQLSKGFANWTSYYIEGSKRFANDSVIYASLQHASRFNLGDNEILAGVYIPLASSITLLMEGNFSPTHKVLPRSSVLGQLLIPLVNGWGMQMGARQTQYANARTRTYIGIAERYWSSFRAAYTLNWTQVKDAGSGNSHVFTLNYYYDEANTAGLSYTFGKEVERVSSTRVLATQVQNVSIKGRHWFNSEWGVSWSLQYHHQGNIYNKYGTSLGLRYRF
jgi:YaiO family outer membrane protein